MLDYFEDSLSNVGLPKINQNVTSNNVTQIRKTYVKRELNQM